MLSYNESLKILKETNALLEGHFVLSSGLHSDKYIQCAKLLSYPEKSKIICSSLSKKITDNFKKISNAGLAVMYFGKKKRNLGKLS